MRRFISTLFLSFLALSFAGVISATPAATKNKPKHWNLPKVSVDDYAHHTGKKYKKSTKKNSSTSKRINTRYDLYVKVDLKKQRMYVYDKGYLKKTWKISGGTKSYPTPTGKFSPGRMYHMFYATNWNRAEMPNSIFFRGAYAIHGTKSVSKLGRPASHGCVRLHRTNAKFLYDWVKKVGKDNVKIEITS